MVDLNDFIEVTLNHQDDFLKVRETLTRIGVSSRKEKILYQSCHMDGKPSNISENDIQRRNAIAKLLEEWALVKILKPKALEDNVAPLHQIKIISYKEKDDWELIAKYNIGKKPMEHE